MMSHFKPLLNDDNKHSLLEPPTPAYTSVTVRRAFIVWYRCGQKNEFKQVCNYFHHLEALEDKLTPEKRASSRLHEFNLISSLPPISYFLDIHYPKLYRLNKKNKVNVKQIEEVRLEDCVFNLEGFYDLPIQKGVTTKDIIKTSQMIRKYCKTHSKFLKNFLSEFLDFAKKTDTKKSVNNISLYIKIKYIKDELETYNNIPKSFSFLDTEEDISNTKVEINQTKDVNKNATFEGDNKSNETRNPNKIRILINEARKKELFLPCLPELRVRNSKSSDENLISKNITKYHQKTSNDVIEAENKI